MKITVNDKQRSCPNQATLKWLLDDLGIKSSGVACEVNGTIVSSDRFEAHELSDGDDVLVVTMVGGG